MIFHSGTLNGNVIPLYIFSLFRLIQNGFYPEWKHIQKLTSSKKQRLERLYRGGWPGEQSRNTMGSPPPLGIANYNYLQSSYPWERPEDYQERFSTTKDTKKD